VASIRQDLADGRCSVVQVVSTNEAVMERRLAEIPAEEWNNLAADLTPKDQVLDYLMGAFPVMAMDAIEDEEGAVTMVPVMVDGVPMVSQEALRLRDELVTHLACLPAVSGVLDAVLDALGTELVAEITGRSRRVVRRDSRRVVERRSASAAKAETDAFMAGKKRVLVFSDAGGAGGGASSRSSASSSTSSGSPVGRADLGPEGDLLLPDPSAREPLASHLAEVFRLRPAEQRRGRRRCSSRGGRNGD